MSRSFLFTGYYWIDYTGGPIPYNALKLQPDIYEFVGQVYNEKYGLMPATIRRNVPYAVFSAQNKEIITNKNVKVTDFF